MMKTQLPSISSQTLDLNDPFSLEKCKSSVTPYLGDETKKQIAQFNQPGGTSYLHLKGLPKDPELPPTPTDGKRPSEKRTRVSETLLLGIINDALGAEVFSYQEQKEGALVQDIAPIPGLESSQSNASSFNFGWHSDDALFQREHRAEGIILYCHRNEGKTVTWYAPVDDILAAMDSRDAQALRQNRFRIRTPDSFHLYGGKLIYSEPRPIITEGPTGTEIAVPTYNVQPADTKDEAAKEALWALHLALREPVAKPFILEPGDILIISNVKGLHAREPISGDRWLQRCYFREDLKALREVTNNNSTSRVFSSEKLFLL